MPFSHRSRQADALQQWGAGRLLLPSLFAQLLAAGAESFCGFLQTLRAGQNFFPPPADAKAWLALYGDHRRVRRVFFQTLMPDPIAGAPVADLIEALEHAARLAKLGAKAGQALETLSPEELRQSLDIAQAFAAFLTQMQQASIQLPRASADPAAFDGIDWPSALRVPEVRFVLLVYVPCLFEHFEYPGRLFCRARAGNHNALVKILQIDRTTLADRRIFREVDRCISEYRRTANENKLAEIKAAFAGEPQTDLDPLKFKKRIGGAIHQLFGLFSQIANSQPIPLVRRREKKAISYNDLASLFDAAAKLRSRNTDPDILCSQAFERYSRKHKNAPFFQHVKPGHKKRV